MATEETCIGGAIYFVAAAGVAYLAVILIHLPGAARRGDFSIYYACALAAHRGLDPYAIDLTKFTRELNLEPDPFRHPADTPSFSVVAEPLARFSPEVAYRVWMTMSLLCLAGSLALLFADLDPKMSLMLTLAAIGFTPIADNIRWAQSQFFVLFGIMAFYRGIRTQRDYLAGAILGGLGLLRGFPLVLGGYLIAQCRWRAIFAMAIACVLGAAVTVTVLGMAPVESFLRVIGGVGGHSWLSLDPRWELAPANVSLDAFVARPMFLLSRGSLAPAWQAFHRALVILSQVAMLVLTFRATLGLDDDSSGRGLSLWVVTMLILTPVVWLHYLVLLLIPFGMVAVASTRGEVGERIWRFAIPSYSAIVLITPLMSTLTFRSDVLSLRTGVLAEMGFLALLSGWIVAWRFATESLSESSSTEVRQTAPPGS